MLVSLNWLKSYVDVAIPPQELADCLTLAGLEVSSVDALGEGISDVVVGRILEMGPHPNADRLSLCLVSDGTESFDIVCGASNMKAGDAVALARVGITLPGGFKIKKAKIRGVTSFGMMCSERELGLGEDHAGILILPSETPLGVPVTEVLGLPDVVLDVELTPNRADCLSVIGVAREVAAITGAELRIPDPKVPEAGPSVRDETSVEILDPDLCHRYAARVVREIQIGPSPLWMRQRLQASGVRSINNVVDVTNYVLLEFGHPLHAFDLHRLDGQRIVVRRARDGEEFTTLDGQQRRLAADTLMICDAQGSVAVAGVMGGLNSEVQEDTVDLLLESAYFHPGNIRRTSKFLGLRTEASYRFERGTDIEGLITALDRTAELIAELAGGTVSKGIWDAFPTPHPDRSVVLRAAKVGTVLGVEVGADEIAGYLGALGFSFTETEPGSFQVDIPTFRVDLEREIDLIEEVARLRGFDTIPATLPEVPMICEALPAGLRLAEAARDALAGSGLREAINLSFADPAEDDQLGVPPDSPLREKVHLENPLSSELDRMRTCLLPGLLRAASLNARRQVRDIRLFEVGRTYHPRAGQQLPQEVLRAAGLLAGRREPLAWWSETETVDFFDGKGVAVRLLDSLGVSTARFEATRELPWLHPGRAARVTRDGTELGWIGQIHPDRLDPYEIPSPVIAFELDLEAVSRVASQTGAFSGLDRYPAVERDVALLVERSVTAQTILDAAASVDSPILRSVALFDAFEGERIGEGKLSLAFRVTYRSEDRTLTEEEVNEVEAALLRRLEEETGARLRDS